MAFNGMFCAKVYLCPSIATLLCSGPLELVNAFFLWGSDASHSPRRQCKGWTVYWLLAELQRDTLSLSLGDYSLCKVWPLVNQTV